MAKEEVKKEKTSKQLLTIIGSIVGAVAVIAIIAVLMGIMGDGRINDDFFKPSDGKYVYTVDTSEITLDEEDEDALYLPHKIHTVYNYVDDDITAVNEYREYEDNKEAAEAYEHILETGEAEYYKEVTLNGKYVVLTAEESEYADMKASEVKETIEFMELLKGMASEDLMAEDEDSVEESDDTKEDTEEK